MTFLFFVLATIGAYAIGKAVWITTCGYLAGRGRGEMTAWRFPLLWLCSLVCGLGGTWILTNGSSPFFAGAAAAAGAVAAGLRQAYKSVQPSTGPHPQTDTRATPIDWTTPAGPSTGPVPLPSQPAPHPVQRCERHLQSMQTGDGTCCGCLLDHDAQPPN